MTGCKRTVRVGVDVLRLGEDEVRIIDIMPGTPPRVVLEIVSDRLASVAKDDGQRPSPITILPLPTTEEASCSS